MTLPRIRISHPTSLGVHLWTTRTHSPDAGYRRAMLVRHRLAALLLASVLLTAGCSDPAPAASPTAPPRTAAPTETASDEAVFREAEAAYRAYVDALNAVDLADPATFEPVFALTTGELAESDQQGLVKYHAEGTRVSGASRIQSMLPLRRTTSESVQLAVCLDVSGVTVRDAAGNSLVSPDRVRVQSLMVTVNNLGLGSRGLVSQVEGRDGPPAC
ncbi:hypothetical protein [Microbacterium thalli]|uniref:Nuclear transport factor 2 family protein n=1 Tax=Microbacterium thalli TaxID=3027921 RepID=A0ABT5SI27_9MICO|nr:hypothetical protein [Microbacterium thalli]MDD7962427.1 hypothetical protein [Microbacterium thalli]